MGSWQRSSQNPFVATGCLQGEVGLGQGRGRGDRGLRKATRCRLLLPPLPPLACLSAGPRGPDPGREKAPEERLDVPFAAGQGGEVLVLARPQLRPDRPGPAPRGCLGIQGGKGELSCWLEPAETERTLRCQSHRSRPPGPLEEPVRGTHTHPATYQFSGLQTVPKASMRWKV